MTCTCIYMYMYISPQLVAMYTVCITYSTTHSNLCEELCFKDTFFVPLAIAICTFSAPHTCLHVVCPCVQCAVVVVVVVVVPYRTMFLEVAV